MRDIIAFDAEMHIPGGNNPVPLTDDQKNDAIKEVEAKAGYLYDELVSKNCKIYLSRQGEGFKIRVACRPPSDSISERILDLFS